MTVKMMVAMMMMLMLMINSIYKQYVCFLLTKWPSQVFHIKNLVEQKKKNTVYTNTAKKYNIKKYDNAACKGKYKIHYLILKYNYEMWYNQTSIVLIHVINLHYQQTLQEILKFMQKKIFFHGEMFHYPYDCFFIHFSSMQYVRLSFFSLFFSFCDFLFFPFSIARRKWLRHSLMKWSDHTLCSTHIRVEKQNLEKCL